MSPGYKAEIVLDSISPAGVRLTTMQVRYPRFIHGEVMTHRVFSRNAMSSRAIPVAKMIEQVLNEPASFVHVGKAQPGMQAREEVNHQTKYLFLEEWAEAGREACVKAQRWSDMGIAKQVVNRILEPWQWMSTIITSTEWDNFFKLRCHPDAQPEFQHLAAMMLGAHTGSTTVITPMAAWHLPYITVEDEVELIALGYDASEVLDALCKISSARCARVSYLTHDQQKPDIIKDMALFERLAGSSPEHYSPLEHQATPDWKCFEPGDSQDWAMPHLHGNLYGWKQHRKFREQGLLPNGKKAA